MKAASSELLASPRSPQRVRPRCRRIDALPLNQVGFIPAAACRRFHAAGIECVGQLLRRPEAMLRRECRLTPLQWQRTMAWRETLAFAAELPEATLGEARLLVAVYRSKVWKLATDRAGAIHHDLRRLALSSNGRKLLHGQTIPTRERLQTLIDSARRRCRMSLPSAATDGVDVTTASH